MNRSNPVNVNQKHTKMKTLKFYMRIYAKAKTHKGKQSAMNKAMLNLSHFDQQKFITWQIERMNHEQ